MAKDKEFSYQITEHLADLSENKGGWIKQINRVSWGGTAPVVDIRQWYYPIDSDEPDRMSKGITLNKDEMKALLEFLQGYDFDAVVLPF